MNRNIFADTQVGFEEFKVQCEYPVAGRKIAEKLRWNTNADKLWINYKDTKPGKECMRI